MDIDSILEMLSEPSPLRVVRKMKKFTKKIPIWGFAKNFHFDLQYAATWFTSKPKLEK